MEARKMKRKRKRLTVEEKVKLIKSAEGKTHDEVAREFDLPRTTVSSILQQKNVLMEHSNKKRCLPMKTIVKRSQPLQDMEKQLKSWILLNTKFQVPLSKNIIQEKALMLYQELPGGSTETDLKKEFHASNGWWQGFVQREGLHNIKLKGEAGSADAEAAKQYPNELAAIIREGRYTPAQIFNADETGLLWKKMPTRSYHVKGEADISGQKVAKDRITLLLGGNADGSHKLKPVLIHKCMNSRALIGVNRENLPVIYRAQSKAWMIAKLFEEWFKNHFKPEVEKFCASMKIPFKILLLLDNAPGHPPSICDMFEEIKVIFLPPNTTALLQPMDQGAISVFKSYYLRNTFRYAIAHLDSLPIEERSSALKTFWKEFTIAEAIRFVAISWTELDEDTLAGVWSNLFPDGGAPFDEHMFIDGMCSEVATMSNQLNLDLTTDDVREYLNSHDAPLTDEDLEALSRECLEDDVDNCGSVTTDPEVIKSSLQQLKTNLTILQVVDKNQERNIAFAKAIEEAVKLYYGNEFN